MALLSRKIVQVVTRSILHSVKRGVPKPSPDVLSMLYPSPVYSSSRLALLFTY